TGSTPTPPGWRWTWRRPSPTRSPTSAGRCTARPDGRPAPAGSGSAPFRADRGEVDDDGERRVRFESPVVYSGESVAFRRRVELVGVDDGSPALVLHPPEIRNSGAGVFAGLGFSIVVDGVRRNGFHHQQEVLRQVVGVRRLPFERFVSDSKNKLAEHTSDIQSRIILERRIT